MTDKQFKQLQKEVNAIKDDAEKKVALEYLDVLKTIKNELSLVFEKHSKNGTAIPRDIWHRFGLEKKLSNTIVNSIQTVLANQNKIIMASIIGTFSTTYYLNGFFIEQAAMIPVFSMLTKKAIDAVVNAPMGNIKWNTRSKGHAVDLIKKTKEIITNGIYRGHGYNKMAKALTERMRISRDKAVKIIQTETGRAYSEATLKNMQEAKSRGVIMKKRWLSTLDNSTRDTHRHLDGQTIGVDDLFQSKSGRTAPAPKKFGVAEEDINCRCTMISIFDGLEPQVRMAREVDKKMGKIVKYDNYPEWYKSLESRKAS